MGKKPRQYSDSKGNLSSSVIINHYNKQLLKSESDTTKCVKSMFSMSSL